MKTPKKIMLAFGCAVGVFAVAMGVWFYTQWNQTQIVFFQEQTPLTQSVEQEDPPVVELEQGAVEADAEPTLAQTEPEQETVEQSEETAQGQTEQPLVNDGATQDDQGTQQAVQQAIEQAAQLLYGYEAEFIGALEALYQQAKADYLAVPEAERTAQLRESLAIGYGLEGAVLEAQCDTLVLQVLSQLGGTLEELGADTSSVETMKQAYIAKKEEQKTRFMALLPSE